MSVSMYVTFCPVSPPLFLYVCISSFVRCPPSYCLYVCMLRLSGVPLSHMLVFLYLCMLCPPEILKRRTAHVKLIWAKPLRLLSVAKQLVSKASQHSARARMEGP
jgi:hypothetical protein